jgi:N4-gp56 family major capsid protein
MAWVFGDNDALRIRQWSELVIRDAEKLQVFAPLMYSLDEASRFKAKDASMAQGVIRLHEDFKGQAGDRVTIANTARVTGEGVAGNALLRDTGEDLDTSSMDIYIQPIAQQLRTAGPLNDVRVSMDARKEFRIKLAQWASRKIEEAIVLILNGLTSWNNTTILDNWGQGSQTTVFGNTIQAFSVQSSATWGATDTCVFAGDATSNATVDSGDVMTAQLLTKLQTHALETLNIPLEPLNVDGEDGFILLCSYKAVEQLLYDPDFVQAMRANTYNKQNPLVSNTIGKFGMFYIRPYPKTLNPAANVSQALVLGKDAMHMAKKEDWKWWEGYEDNANRRAVMAITAFLGMAPTYVGATLSRRNALGVRHYARS